MGGLLLGPPADPITKGLGEHGGPESHTPPDFSDTDRRTRILFSVSVSSSEKIPLWILFLAICKH